MEEHGGDGRVPKVGVGCIVVHEDEVLLVRSHGGRWSTPGGHLDFGESPAECAIRETEEETGVQLSGVEFVAITNDFVSAERHYVTIWMRAETDAPNIEIGDTLEIERAGWFALDDLPTPRHVFFENLLASRSLPPEPANSPFASVRTEGRE